MDSLNLLLSVAVAITFFFVIRGFVGKDRQALRLRTKDAFFSSLDFDPNNRSARNEAVNHTSLEVEFEEFLERSAVFQPYLNMNVLPHNFWVNEVADKMVTLGTFDMPDFGRNYELYYASERIGKLSLVPNPRYGKVHKDGRPWIGNDDWADIRISLMPTIQFIDGQDLHQCLRMLFGMVLSTTEKRDETGGATIASQLLLESLWDRVAEPEMGQLVDHNLAGPFGIFLVIEKNWRELGFDPWEEHRRMMQEERAQAQEQ